MNLPLPVTEALKRAANDAKTSPYALLQKCSSRPLVAARAQVFRELRAQGFTLQWIARWFGMNHATVKHHLDKTPHAAPVLRAKRVAGPNSMGTILRPRFQCCTCGFISFSQKEFLAEDYHLICKDVWACRQRHENYLIFAKQLAADLRHRCIDTA